MNSVSYVSSQQSSFMIVSTNQSLMDIDSIHKHDNHQITHFLGFFKHEKKSLIKKEKKNKLKSIMLALKFDEINAGFANRTLDFKGYKKLIKHIQLEKKIDNSNRRQIWLNLCQIDRLQEIYGPKYLDLLDQLVFPSLFEEVIGIDIDRQLEHKQTVHKILDLYSKRNSRLGYCQGFTYIVNFIISVGFNFEQTFFMFCHLIENVMNCDYYSNLIEMIVDQNMFKNLFKIILPKIYKKLRQKDFDIDSFNMNWFISIFTNTGLKKEIVLFIWDQLFSIGRMAITIAAMVVFRFLEKPILKANSFDDLLSIFKNDINKIQNVSKFQRTFHSLRLSRKEFSRIGNRLKSILEEYNKSTQKLSIKSNYHKDCNTDYPICIASLNYQRNYGKLDCLVLQNNSVINSNYQYIDYSFLDHYQQKPNQKPSQQQQQLKQQQQSQQQSLGQKIKKIVSTSSLKHLKTNQNDLQ